jgi:hypothetical protein
MAEALIPFGPQQSDAEPLSGAQPEAMNVCIDQAGTVRRRPGIQTLSAAPAGAVDATGISLLHETEAGELYAVGNHPTQKSLYRIAGGAAVDVSALSGVKVNGVNRPTVAETEAMLVFAAGDPPTKYLYSTGQTSALGGGPPAASHVIANSSRLLLNNTAAGLRGTINYSGPALGSSIAGHETWVGLTAGSFQAEARPDVVPALHENTAEVFAFGRTSLQFFSPDASTTYAPVSTREHGVAAPYSIVKADQAFVWLDHQRRIVASDGRSLKVLSDAIHSTLNGLSRVDDCYGYRVHTGFVEALVFTFPTDGRTFAYQVGGGWSQWSRYQAANWLPFTVSAHFLGAGSNTNYVGTTDGKVARLVDGAVDDLGDTIVASVTSGFQSHGTTARKRTRALRVALRRGETPSSPGTVGLMRWRDDLGAWSDSLPVYVGAPGDSHPVLTFRSVGWPYRMRQWQFEFGSTVSYSLVGITEDFEVLGS